MKNLPLLMLALGLLVSCGTKSDPGLKSYDSLNSFFTQEGAPTQHFTSNSSSHIQLITKKGNKVIFTPNAFVTSDNKPVSGTVKFEIREITKADEMILSNKQTMSDEGILESQGEFFVRVTQNGKQLKLAPNKLMRIEVPNVDHLLTRFMQVYNGKIRPDNSIIWTLNTSPSNTITLQNASNNPADSSAFQAVMNSDSLNWLNIDKLVWQPKITYTINNGDTPDANATMIFIHFTGRNSVINYSETVASQMIEGPATIIGLCIQNNQLYSAFLPVTMADNGSATLNFNLTTDTEFKNKLRLLN